MAEEIVIPLNPDGTYAEPVSLQAGDRVEKITETRIADDGTEFEQIVAIRIIRP